MSELVVLRYEKGDGGLRALDARLHDDGKLTFEGQDLGAGVESFWGEGLTEYEWTWTVPPQGVAKIATALGVQLSEVLGAVQKRFAGAAAAGLGEFLEAEEITYERWSRVGD